MAKQSKRFRALQENCKPGEPVSLDKAIDVLKSFDGTKFDQTVEIHMHLGVDPKQAD